MSDPIGRAASIAAQRLQGLVGPGDTGALQVPFGREPEGTGIRQFTSVGHRLVDTAVPLVERPPVAGIRPQRT